MCVGFIALGLLSAGTGLAGVPALFASAQDVVYCGWCAGVVVVDIGAGEGSGAAGGDAAGYGVVEGGGGVVAEVFWGGRGG